MEDGSAIFIDTNIFIYHFIGASPQCTGLFGRCETRELRGYTSALVLAEVCHRLMTIEALEKKLISPGSPARKLARRPDLVRKLTTPEAALGTIPRTGIEIIALTDATLRQGLRIQKQYGVLTNDSLIVATMLDGGFHVLATADRRLAAVSEIDSVVPNDLNIAP
jgi:predicted nucleic acid-binding protein